MTHCLDARASQSRAQATAILAGVKVLDQFKSAKPAVHSAR